MPCGPRVLEKGAQGGVGQACATVELVVFQLRQHPKALCIAFKAQEVVTLDIAHIIQPATLGGLLEPVANGVFTGVTKRRIANVVGQAGRLHHHAQIGGVAPLRQGTADRFAHAHAQGAADAANFERVGEAGMDMIVAVDRVDLGLAPQAAKGARENDAVVVFVKRAAPELFRAVVGFAEAFAIKQGLPIQGAMLR